MKGMVAAWVSAAAADTGCGGAGEWIYLDRYGGAHGKQRRINFGEYISLDDVRGQEGDPSPAALTVDPTAGRDVGWIDEACAQPD